MKDNNSTPGGSMLKSNADVCASSEESARKDRLAAERERQVLRENERKLREAKRKKELEEIRERSEKERLLRELLDEIEKQFRSAPFVFASDFPADENPLNLKREGVFYLLNMDFVTDRVLFKLTVKNGVANITPMSRKLLDGSLYEKDALLDKWRKSKVLVLEDGGSVWIVGTGCNVWTENITPFDDVQPMKTESGVLTAVFSALGRLPSQKYRLTMKSSSNGETAPLGTITYGETLPWNKINEILEKKALNSRAKNVNIPKPKLKKFVPNVILYTGDIIRREQGRTYVPRSFTHLGTKVHGYVKAETVNQAERQWRDLKTEAERQEKKEIETKRKNDEILRQYESELKRALGGPITQEEISLEAKRFRLLIERSRSKITKTKGDRI